MFSLLLQFEASYQLKQKAFLLFAFIFFLIGLLAGRQGFAPANVNFNAGYQINFYTGLITLGSVFIIMFLSISGVLRDSRHNMEHLIFSTSIKKVQFFWSRFLGLYIFSLLAVAPFLFGYAGAIFFSDLDPERVAAFNVMSYIDPFLLIVVPNVFFLSAIIFAVTILSKSNIATYVSAFFIYMLYIVSSIFLNSPLVAQAVPASPEAMSLAALADPFALSAFFEQTQYWTAFQKNTQTLSLSGLYLWNRLIWLGTSLIILFITYGLFSFRAQNKKIKKKEIEEKIVTEIEPYNRVEVLVGARMQIVSLFSLLKLELSSVFKSLPFVAVNGIWILVVFMECFARIHEGGPYNDSWYPLTNLMIEQFTQPLLLFGLILIVFYSGELVWRERGLKFNGIIDATPVANWALFLSKFITLIILPAILILSSIVLSLGFQIYMGYHNFEIEQYLAMFYFNGMSFFIFCLIAMFIQSIASNKILGMGITLIIFFSSFMAPYIGIEHLLLRIGYLSTPDYTNMTGYSGKTLQFGHLSLYWLGFTGILTLISFKIWHRGSNARLKVQFQSLRANWKKWELTVLASCGLLFLTMGGVIYNNTHIINDYYTSEDQADYRENYERKFKTYESLPSMHHTEMKTEVDLYPKDSRYVVKANYLLVNREEEAINQLFITEREPFTEVALENAVLIEHDSVFGTYLFEFKESVAPQQKVKFSYVIDRSFKGYETSREIIENGTYLCHRNFEPYLKYRSSLEINDNFERKKRGLPKKEEENFSDEHLHHDDNKIGKVKYETIISTVSDEIAIGIGSLVKQWNDDGRNYYQYQAKEFIMPTMGYFSSAYKVQKEIYKGISLEQYYYPAHDFNIDSITTSTKQALDYCISNFGDYPFDYMRIAEVPSHWPFGGFAHPGVISMIEDNLYLIDIRDPEGFNLVAKRIIHEVGHQWWGHVLNSKFVPGGTIFVEGFAKYTEAVIMEKVYGKRALLQLSANARERYFRGRAFATEAEPPLYLEDGQSYLSYGKSFAVMLALRDLLGEETVNSVLKTLIDKYGNKEQFELTSLLFLDELYNVSTPAQCALINDWFKKVITYDLSLEGAEVTALDNGKYEVAIQVSTKRFEANEEGEDEPIAINEPIVIGIFSEHPSTIKDESNILYLKPSHFDSTTSTISITVDELPKFVSIDPYSSRLDEDFVDNMKEL